MPKPIKWGPYLEPLREKLNSKFSEMMANTNICDTKFKLELELGELFSNTNKALLLFTPEAYIKMLMTVIASDKELAMHGLVVRDGNTFLVRDTFLYPQEVTAATVESADKDYGIWLSRIPNDTFEQMRFQMHSHVRMGVTPSSTDNSFYKELLTGVQDFYIFLIMNKQLDMWINIYDVSNNILYEQKDIDWDIQAADGSKIQDWVLNEIEKYIKPRKTYVPPATSVGANMKVDEKKTSTTTRSHGGATSTTKEASTKRKPGRPRKDEPGNPPVTTFWNDDLERQAAERELAREVAISTAATAPRRIRYREPSMFKSDCSLGCLPCYHCFDKDFTR